MHYFINEKIHYKNKFVVAQLGTCFSCDLIKTLECKSSHHIQCNLPYYFTKRRNSHTHFKYEIF